MKVVVVVGLILVVAESVFITEPEDKISNTKTKYPISKAEEEEDKEALLMFNRLVAEVLAKIDILDSETFAEEFSRIGRLIVEENAKIDEKRVKKLLLQKDIHIPHISVQDKQLLRCIMSNCVDQYYLTSRIDDPHYGDFCIAFFSKIEKFNGSLHKLQPAHVDALKQYYYYYARSRSRSRSCLMFLDTYAYPTVHSLQ